MKKLLLFITFISFSSFADYRSIKQGEYIGTIKDDGHLCFMEIGDDGYGEIEISVNAGDTKANPYFPEYLKGNTTKIDKNTYKIEDAQWPLFKFTLTVDEKGIPLSVQHENVAHYYLDITCENLQRQ